MPLDRENILADNLKESFVLYQRSIVWAMTASATFFMITLTFGEETIPSVSVLYGKLSGPTAWYLALVLFFVLGILAGSALKNAEAVLLELEAGFEGSEESQMDDGALQALLFFPSLATNPNSFVRIGTALLSPIVILVGFGMQLLRELPTSQTRDIWWWSGLVVFVLLVTAPYAGIVWRLWVPFASRYPQPPDKDAH